MEFHLSKCINKFQNLDTFLFPPYSDVTYYFGSLNNAKY